MNSYVQKNAQLDSMEIYCGFKGFVQLRVFYFKFFRLKSGKKIFY